MLINSLSTVTPDEATELIRGAGVQICTQTLRAGIEQGVFPFGVCIQQDKRIFIISKKKLIEWIAEFCGKVVDLTDQEEKGEKL